MMFFWVGAWKGAERLLVTASQGVFGWIQ